MNILHHYRLHTITPKGVKILVDLLGFKEGKIAASRLRRRAGNPQDPVGDPWIADTLADKIMTNVAILRRPSRLPDSPSWVHS